MYKLNIDVAFTRMKRNISYHNDDRCEFLPRYCSADPANVHAIDDIAILTGYQIRVVVTTSEDIANVIARLARVGDVVQEGEEGSAEEAAVVELHDTADDAPVVRLVHQLVGQAVEQGASDLHLTPDGEELRVRLRVDGVLHDVTTVPSRLAAASSRG